MLLVLKFALSFPINEFHKKKDLKELAYINYDKKKQHNLGLPTFKLLAITKNLLRLTR